MFGFLFNLLSSWHKYFHHGTQVLPFRTCLAETDGRSLQDGIGTSIYFHNFVVRAFWVSNKVEYVN